MSATGEYTPALSLSAHLRIDGVCQRFEAAWKADQRPRLEDFLEAEDREQGTIPRQGAISPGSLWRKLLRLLGFLPRQPIRTAPHVSRQGDPGREQQELLRELLRLDLEYRRQSGENPTEEEYRQRLPHRTDLVQRVFQSIQATSHDSPPTFSAGDRVGPYTLERHIHGGSFGQVWIGRHEILGQRCAVKILSAKLGNIELDGIRRYKTIADTQTGLVPVQDVGPVGGGGYYYTMPLADDVNGRAVLRDAAEYEPMTLERYRQMHRPAPIDRVLAVALHLLPSLHALHEVGFVHRDVKPGNIVRVEGTWKFCDLGLLVRRDEIRVNCGTPTFMPPEGVTDRRADIYAFGKTLYLLATDYEHANFHDFMNGNLAIPGSDDRRQALQEVIRRACQPAPNGRFQTALEMHQAINPLVRTTRLTIVLDDDFASFTQARLDEFIKAIRERGFNIQGIPACEEGSVRVTLTLTQDEAEKLAALVEAGEFARFRAVRAEVGALSLQRPSRATSGRVPAAKTRFKQPFLMALAASLLLLTMAAGVKMIFFLEAPPASDGPESLNGIKIDDSPDEVSAHVVLSKVEIGNPWRLARTKDHLGHILMPEDLHLSDAQLAQLTIRRTLDDRVCVLFHQDKVIAVISSDRGTKTARGLSLGQTLDPLFQRYPEPAQHILLSDKSHIEVRRYPSLGIGFEIQNGRITSMTLYPPQKEQPAP